MTDYQRHPLSSAFPTMTADAYVEMRSDIASNGLRVPIVVFEDKILDGWHRYRACQETGAHPRFEPFTGSFESAVKFVVSANLLRRHLDTSQRALIAARIAGLTVGRPSAAIKNRAKLPDKADVQNAPSNAPTKRSLDDAADVINVSRRTVVDARTVLTKATPEVVQKVERGEISVSRAAKEVRASEPRPVRPPKPEPAQRSLTGIEEPIEIAPRTIKEWSVLSDREKEAHLNHRNPAAKLNRQDDGEDDNLIDWAKWTWNPMTGCLHSCPYCYARDIAERFSGTSAFPNGFNPTLRADRLSAPLNGTPRSSEDPREKRIFTGSMTDLFGRWVPPEWIESVLSVARQATQWDFLMLTKFPKRMSEFEIPENVWMGTSVDCQARVAAAEAAFIKVRAKVKWLSVEPMIEPLKFKHLDRFDLVVIGGASPSRQTPQWIPPFSWLDDLMRQADAAGCAVFLKSNLYRKEQPLSGPRYRFLDRAPDVFHYLSHASTDDQKVQAA